MYCSSLKTYCTFFSLVVGDQSCFSQHFFFSDLEIFPNATNENQVPKEMTTWLSEDLVSQCLDIVKRVLTQPDR